MLNIVHFFYLIKIALISVSNVCQTKGCVDVASMVMSSMDDTVNPCTDFYKYACGGWEKDTPIPPGFSYWDRTQELAYKNTYHLHQLIGVYFCLTGFIMNAINI